ncbi:hypothetical protein OHA77_28945 [Streptosporangium sp. NBC_01639]|uniref:hypothetical protein n=1 Tax=Streptosporangium sp. NBC_01639 TaxID=2975948 RepID=UPI00386DA78D|nr:hypothetical protein OHA77_28945 [Streptosporangium sp. NBC_01639]
MSYVSRRFIRIVTSVIIAAAGTATMCVSLGHGSAMADTYEPGASTPTPTPTPTPQGGHNPWG